MIRGSSRKARSSRVRAGAARGLSAGAESWVKRALRKMTLEQKLGQLLMIPFYGGFAATESAEFQELLREVQQNRIGGLMVATRPGPLGLRRSQAYPTAALINRLQERAKIPLLVAADFERGTAMRLDEGTSFPHAMAVAATGRAGDAYTVGRITAREARAAGVHWIFAPVADVNSDPENPIINVRSFGEGPERVAAFVAAYVRGVEENGGLATAKHFPGHGDTQTDSHLDLPTVNGDRAHLERVELVPFRAALSAGVSTIMTGHLAVPALEPDANLPATLSSKITTDLLRREMRFEGLVVTDSLDMGGVALRYAPGEAAVRSILAGSDLLLVPGMSDAALASLRGATEAGRIPMARIDDAVRHILKAKARLGLHQGSQVSLDSLPDTLGRMEFGRAAADIADRGVTLLRDELHLLPLDATKPLRALLIAIAGDADVSPGQEFEREVRWRVDSLETLRFDTRFASIDAGRMPREESYDVAIVALFVRVADRKGSVALPQDQVAAVHRLLSSEKPVLVVSFGSPYVIKQFPEAKEWLAVFSNADVAQRAAARAIFGQVPISGRIPVSVPGTVSMGSGIDVAARSMELAPADTGMSAKLAPAYRLLEEAVADGAFPGGVLAVGHCGRLAAYPFGKQSSDERSPDVSGGTIYDAASLTKPVVTTTLAAMLEESGQLDLDAPLARYLPEWAAGANADWRARVTPRHLLTHTSGLPAHREYFRQVKSAREMIARVLAEPLAYEPGSQSIYSDIGFIALGEILQRLTGRALDELARVRIFAPVGMTDTLFQPPKGLRRRIAPTQIDAVVRKRALPGEVYDENAWAMGGVAGHAGMFSTGADLARFCQMLLNGGIYAHQRLLQRKTVARFTAPAALAGNERTLGWTVPTEGSSSGHYFSKRSFGHTGFTGPSIWVDPEKHLFVVLLTNAHRVHPAPENDKIRRVRPALHDAVVEALGLAR
jgi:beta-N-acetylhexosaminidase